MNPEKGFAELPEWVKFVLAVINGEWDWEDEAQRQAGGLRRNNLST